MYVREIQFTDYAGNERKEKFEFNLSEAEVLEMETEIPGGFSGLLEQIVASQDVPQIMKIFKRIILTAYGRRSLDGRTFDKSEELKNNFLHTEAYSKLYVELSTDAEAASKFILGIMPAKTAEMVEKMQKEGKIPDVNGTTPNVTLVES